MKLIHMKIERSKLDAIDADERALVLAALHVVNELNVLIRVIRAAHVDDSIPALQKGGNVIFLVAVKILVGKLYEGWQLLQKAYYGARISRKYATKLPPEALASERFLKDYFGRNNVIKTARNKAASHYDIDFMKDAYSTIANTEDLDIYAGDGINTLYWFAEIFANGSLMHAIDPSNFENAMTELETDSTTVHLHLLELLSAISFEIVKEHIGGTLDDLQSSEMVIEAPDVEANKLHFFVEHSGESDAIVDAAVEAVGGLGTPSKPQT